MDPVTIDPKTIKDLRTQVATDAAKMAFADMSKMLRKGFGLPDTYDFEKDTDGLLKAAKIPTRDEMLASFADSLKASESVKLIGDISDSRREKSSNGYPRPPFSFREMLLGIAAADPRTVRTRLPKVKTDAEAIAKWCREQEAPRYEDDTLGKALDLSSGAAGGFLVPEYYSDQLLQPRPGAAPCLALGTNVPMGDMRVLHFPRLETLFAPDIYWEEYMPGTTKTPTDTPEFDRPYLQLQNYYVLWSLTHDLLKFNNVGIENLMVGWIAGAMQRELDRLMLVGDIGGLGDPYDGILNTAGVQNIALLVPGTLGWQDLRNIRAYVPNQYHASSGYVMNQQAESECDMLPDAFGNPLLNRDMTGARPNLLDGHRYVVDNQIPNNIGGANQTVIFFGDLSYWLQGNGGQQFSVSDHAGFKENMTWYKVDGYADGVYAITEAMAYLEAVPTA